MTTITITTKILIKKLQKMESTKEIALYINNNAVELVQEIPALTYRKRFIFKLVYDKYQLIMVKEPWEYTLFPRYAGKKLELLYKNIVVRLHNFQEQQGFKIYSWYNTTNQMYDAIALYREYVEDVEIKSRTVEYFFFTPKDGKINDYSIKDKKKNTSLIDQPYEIVVSAAPIDLQNIDYDYHRRKGGVILEYEKKQEKDVEAYIGNSKKKIPEQEFLITRTEKEIEEILLSENMMMSEKIMKLKQEDYGLKMTQGFDIEMLKKYIQQNPEKKLEFYNMYPERKETEKQLIQEYEKDGSYDSDEMIEEEIAELKQEESDWESEPEGHVKRVRKEVIKLGDDNKI